MKVIAEVNALSGTEGRVLLSDISGSVEKVEVARGFPRPDQYHHRCEISLNELPVGSYLVKYFLGDVCWSMSSFEVVP